MHVEVPEVVLKRILEKNRGSSSKDNTVGMTVGALVALYSDFSTLTDTAPVFTYLSILKFLR